MKPKRITDPFDPKFPDWYWVGLGEMQKMFGAGFKYRQIPESAPEPWYFDERPLWRLCWVRKWVRDCGGIEAARMVR